MRCLKCHYSLANLTERRCPECGWEFDPNDAATFKPPHFSVHPMWVFMGLGLIWLAAAFVLVSALTAALWW